MYRTLILLIAFGATTLSAAERRDVWPGLAPGETTKSTGELLPFRKREIPPVTRVVKITRPTYSVHLAPQPNGTGVVILPGGGFGKVVPDKEGSEAAKWLNKHGISAFVLSYRTTTGPAQTGWVEPLQDAQRLLSLVRHNARDWGLKPDRIGLVGFSAGGQVAARLLGDQGQLAYDPIDDIDQTSHRPDFAMLIYPWNIYDGERDQLIQEVGPPANCPPTFLVHTHDDNSSSLGAVLFYASLKRHSIPAELHVYGNGGHGYGLRNVANSQISTWPKHGGHWLVTQGYAKPTDGN